MIWNPSNNVVYCYLAHQTNYKSARSCSDIHLSTSLLWRNLVSMCQIEGPRSCVDWERGRDAQTPTKGLAVAAGSEWRSRTPRLLWSSDTNLEKLRTFERKTLNSSTVWVSSEKLTFKTVVKRTYPCLEAPTSSLASALVTGVTERGRGGVGVRDSSSLGCTNSPGPLVR